jgi:hypothetical protein
MVWPARWPCASACRPEVVRRAVGVADVQGLAAMSFGDWLLADLRLPKAVHGKADAEHTWWRVMCLTGVDYFLYIGS